MGSWVPGSVDLGRAAIGAAAIRDLYRFAPAPWPTPSIPNRPASRRWSARRGRPAPIKSSGLFAALLILGIILSAGVLALLDSIPRPGAPHDALASCLRASSARPLSSSISIFTPRPRVLVDLQAVPFPRAILGDGVAAKSFATFALAFFTRPIWIGSVRPFRRSHRAQGHPGYRLVDHGHFDRVHRLAADLRIHRGVSAAALPGNSADWGTRYRLGR